MWTTPGSPTLLLFVLLYHEFPSGLFTIAVCVMSNFSKSRVLALQILTAMCGLGGGHSQVSDAVSTSLGVGSADCFADQSVCLLFAASGRWGAVLHVVYLELIVRLV